MKKGGIGGANTKTGLDFEFKSDISKYFENKPDYSVYETQGKIGKFIKHKGADVARIVKQRGFSKLLLEYGVDYKTIISKELRPDSALFVIVRDTLFIIEMKHQEVGGSVDEKLQTCDFKRKQYTKLVAPLKWQVEYIYLLADFFKHPAYKDVLEYIRSVRCNYFFDFIPLTWFGLPE